VPLRWCNATPTTPKLLWDDAGTGGKRGSLWAANSLGLMAVGRGTEPPRVHIDTYKIFESEVDFFHFFLCKYYIQDVLRIDGHV